ncbi:hypothetical protein RclHR1_00870001 [Rhizophagus clarus]|uniref:Uncharacterized protein n=1 Tax=Rhizophagus clarus TaxID=94130 RepID=A0A2Z6SFV9_9GLOM|nr:hypothetical protein RclHR1_00870001 [Rhizophagus clarus]GES99351.1 hypothetical protein GLOIN_2v1782606 [Rhizophagus clarus]
MATDMKGPETLKAPYFTLTTTLKPDDLANASSLLLSTVKSKHKLTQGFRMEVKFLQNTAQFRICLDTVLWYDVYLRMELIDETARVAREYIKNTRMQIFPEDDGPFVIDHKEVEKDTAFIRCNNKGFAHNKQACEYDHTEFVCKGNVTTRDGRETQCDFHSVSKLIVKEFSSNAYLVLVRRESIRELLFLPCPSQQQHLKFHSIAANFGKWETAQSRDKYSQNYHAHIHLLFDKKSWDDIKKLIETNETLFKLNARDYPGPNYLLQHCAELEEQRLSQVEHQCTLATISKLSENVEKLSENVGENNKILSKLSENVGENNIIFSKLSENVDNNNQSFVNAISTLTTAINTFKTDLKDLFETKKKSDVI